jgi:hypothetical protein
VVVRDDEAVGADEEAAAGTGPREEADLRVADRALGDDLDDGGLYGVEARDAGRGGLGGRGRCRGGAAVVPGASVSGVVPPESPPSSDDPPQAASASASAGTSRNGLLVMAAQHKEGPWE